MKKTKLTGLLIGMFAFVATHSWLLLQAQEPMTESWLWNPFPSIFSLTAAGMVGMYGGLHLKDRYDKQWIPGAGLAFGIMLGLMPVLIFSFTLNRSIFTATLLIEAATGLGYFFWAFLSFKEVQRRQASSQSDRNGTLPHAEGE